MIKSITVTTFKGDSIELELARPDKTGFVIGSVTGLGPVKANINTTKMATHHGSRFNSAILDERNIVIPILFQQTGTESIEDLRHKTYKYFPLHKDVKLKITTDTRVVTTTGYVESNEPNIFSSNEGCTVSILCPDPFLYSEEVTETVFYGVNANFEFPFENDSVTEPLLELGIIENRIEGVVNYTGDSEVGVTIIVHAIGDATDLVIYNITTGEHMDISTAKLEAMTGSAIVLGDTITINTRDGDKSIMLMREGRKINILNCLDRNSDWFTLTAGDNVFAYTAGIGRENLQFRIKNNIIYDGV